ncbi:MAG TPA: A/G-specific adenine glycosylase [Candidatus Paceibacterota bacterium]|nr:A/G-specific adenine glycosylase [Candidatus Paceibacterota bacterium]
MTPQQFRILVWRHFRKEGRHDLPWRTTTDAYRILVSEVMLQQTQVERVVPFYLAFLKKFPTVRKLADASLSSVLQSWQGLGYNRRAKMLHEAAKTVVRDYHGKMPTDSAILESLPGVGPYTARAVAAFSANTDSIFIETNIRTAVTHHFFGDREQVADAEVIAVLEQAYPKGRAREWYAALMDYGSFLKRSGVRVNARAKGYAKQKSFAGSAREARGRILKALIDSPKTTHILTSQLGPERKEQMKAQLAALAAEGLIERKGEKYQLPG